MMVLPTSVYTANRGYAWSNIPPGVTEQKLNSFCRDISVLRGDFPDPLRVEVGVVSDGVLAAVFTLQNVDRWDSVGRASDYYAFAFFPVKDARQIDFIQLINNDFFWTPSHTPTAKLTYDGTASEEHPKELALSLAAKHHAWLENPHAVGSMLEAFGAKSDKWTCRLYTGNIVEVNCNPW